MNHHAMKACGGHQRISQREGSQTAMVNYSMISKALHSGQGKAVQTVKDPSLPGTKKGEVSSQSEGSL